MIPFYSFPLFSKFNDKNQYKKTAWLDQPAAMLLQLYTQ
ncbi:hypothetical protein KIS1582_2222 [Cytobacillus firmus]|uniref:Uncharacterized protein n=1 Tax=Cytobacillus firmus TaxID=1399 RepID=A0A800MWW3_CYTFI|nr:hypothetical protein KIS1582_2222 [Cytobacillus firmus]